MRSLLFNFRPSVPAERQDAVLQAIAAWEGVRAAGRLYPEANDPELGRMGYVYVDDEAPAEPVATRLSALPELEDVSVPTERHLL